MLPSASWSAGHGGPGRLPCPEGEVQAQHAAFTGTAKRVEFVAENMHCVLNPSSATYWLRDVWTRYLSLPLGFPQQEDGDMVHPS